MDTSSFPGSYSRHSHQSNSLLGQESPSVASSQAFVPPSTFFSSLAPPRPQVLPDQLPPVTNANKSPVGFAGPDYSYRLYGTSSGSPSSVTGSSIHESHGTGDPYGSAGISPTHLTANNLSAQKRAYRQRRKDPSCDACRERKVKCDATDTSSCSECSSRSVKCQFTKETNRRMSSIKQVQDLQTQLAEAKQEINHLRSLLPNQQVPLDCQIIDSAHNLPGLGGRREQEHGQPIIHNFDHVRKAIKTYSRGVFKAPPLYRDMMPTPDLTTKEIIMPPLHVSRQLLAQYHSHLHRHAPMIHWMSFNQQIDRIYAQGSFQGCTQIWVGLFFAVLANGTIQTIDTSVEGLNPDVDGMKYVIIAARLLNTWMDNLTIDHARCSFLTSNFLVEMNIKESGWVALGSALRMVQALALDCETGSWTPLEAEARRRVAWTIFGYDRLYSLEGKPLTLIEEDFVGHASWPKHADEQWLHPHPRDFPLSPLNSIQAQAAPSLIIPVIRMVSGLKKTLKSPVIPQATLKTYDEYFRMILSSYPEECQPHGDAYIDPFSLTLCIPLLTARFILYRHNITPHAPPPDRSDAITRIAAIAQDTVRLIARTMQPPPNHNGDGPASWSDLLKAHADNATCRHLWRCTMALAFRGDFEGALACVRVCRAIEGMRKINIACGRNLSYFLERLTERMRVFAGRGWAGAGAGTGGWQRELDGDEEMLALLTGDMQGDWECAWVWAGSEKRASIAAASGSVRSALEETSTSNLRMNGTGNGNPERVDVPYSSLLTEKEINDWGGFERCERLIEGLREEQRRWEGGWRETNAYYHRSSQNEAKRLQLAPPEGSTATIQTQTQKQQSPGTMTGTGSEGSTPVGASRISIANII